MLQVQQAALWTRHHSQRGLPAGKPVGRSHKEQPGTHVWGVTTPVRGVCYLSPAPARPRLQVGVSRILHGDEAPCPLPQRRDAERVEGVAVCPSPCGATWRAQAEPGGKNLARGEGGRGAPRRRQVESRELRGS